MHKTWTLKESQLTVMLRVPCECLHIWGAKNSVVFENNHRLKMIYISFIINKKTLIHLPVNVYYEILPHCLLRLRSSSMLWWNRISVNSLCESPRIPRNSLCESRHIPRYSLCKSPRIPRLSFLSFQRTYVELVNNILFDIPSLVGLPWTENTEAMISHLLYKISF